jgi:hypothetical protein
VEWIVPRPLDGMALSNRFLLILLTFAALISGCADKQQPAFSELPTGPSTLAPAPFTGGGGWGPNTVNYPPRADGLDFRNQLEAKYANQLRRPVTTTYVDMEGEVAWIGEYDRYRVNGCDHNTATQRALSQVDGAAASPVCDVRFFPETAIYPSRDDLVDFRRQLGTKYQAMGRTAQSAVDPDGAGIWIGEYLRYRTSGCDHATAVQNVMTQIDGNPTPETCLEQCSYAFSPSYGSAPAVGGAFSAQLDRVSGACNWIAESEVPWITMNRPITGGNHDSMSYVVTPNPGGSRRGNIRVTIPGGTLFFEVSQDAPGANLTFQFYDPATSTVPSTECQLKTPNTICTLFAVSTVLLPTVTYNWRVTYSYNGSRIRTQDGNLPTISFTESCATAAGSAGVIPLSVTLTATDTAGNIRTLTSGQGGQPALQLRALACS